MPSHKETQILPYTTCQLFELVADIEHYPDFLPWCRAARILERKPGHMQAELIISFKHLTERYTSNVTLEQPENSNDSGSIKVHMIKGPFEHLENNWQFTPLLDGGTQIDFLIDFKFRSRILDAIIGKLFGRATQKMMSAFCTRADELYKKEEEG